jgi:2-methylisocitrate lyase-like PEP mutase family enzyme
MATQREKSKVFAELHARPGAFLIPNPWDAGSAKILTALGFEALATSSGACAGTFGRREGRVSRSEALAHARAIVEASDVPVAADLEKGFGDAPEDAATTIQEASAVGLVGGSIEDASGDPQKPIYDLGHATDRIIAAVSAARGVPFKFMLTARAENFIRGNPDLEDTIRRLKAYEKAGADVLFAPGLPDVEAVRRVCASLSRAVQLYGWYQGQIFRCRGSHRSWRQANQPCVVALPRSHDGPSRGSKRSKRPRHVLLH